MRNRFLAVLSGLMVLILAHPAAAQATIGSNATGDVAVLNDSHPMPGEVITPPGWQGPLTEYSLWIRRGSATLTVRPVIYEWDNLGPVGPPIWTGAPTVVPDTTYTEIVAQPHVYLDATKTYWLAVAQVTPGEFGELEAAIVNNDPGGYYAYRDETIPGWGRSLGGELHFSATFAAPPGIPTLGEWGMILFALILAGGAAMRLGRRTA